MDVMLCSLQPLICGTCSFCLPCTLCGPLCEWLYIATDRFHEEAHKYFKYACQGKNFFNPADPPTAEDGRFMSAVDNFCSSQFMKLAF